MPYWDESACYVFGADEIDRIEKVTYALNDMCLKAVEHIFTHNLLDAFGIPLPYRPWLERSWDTDEHTIYGRFDLAYATGGEPKLLEYNADTPTALLEAAVIQWFWLKDTHPNADQFNSIHERLIEAWQTLKPRLTGPVYFSSLRGHVEDYMTVNYVRDTAMQAGIETEFLAIEDIAWHPARRQFVAPGGKAINTVFKLYPWEWMLREEFGPHLTVGSDALAGATLENAPEQQSDLADPLATVPSQSVFTAPEPAPFGNSYVRKPVQGREGANVTIVIDGEVVQETEGIYDGPYIFQEFCPLANNDGNYAVLGSWLVNGYACGIGVREDEHPVTRNTSRFVPHRIA